MAVQENYGIDAPTVVRNLSLGGLALVVAGVVLGLSRIALGVVPSVISAGFFMSLMALWMMASSLWIKRLVMRRMLNERTWRGDETVLDVGCGRGLVLIEAAQRVPRGHATGIDMWQAKDLSDNNPEQTMANARIAGVADRVTIDTGDACALPYPDARFDVVTSMTVIHNIASVQGRKDAVDQIWRVVKPGGQILVFDIMHARTYYAQLRALGAVDAKIKGPILMWGPLGWRFSLRKPV